MRHIVAAALVCVLAACAASPGFAPGCASSYECEIQAYEKAR